MSRSFRSERQRESATYNQAVRYVATNGSGTTYPMNQDTLASTTEVLMIAALFGINPVRAAGDVMFERWRLKMPIGHYVAEFEEHPQKTAHDAMVAKS